MDTATRRTNPQIRGQPMEMASGPPPFQAWKNVVNVPARTEMIVNEIAKFVNPLHTRVSSCLYPRSASCCSSRVTSGVDIPRYLLRSGRSAGAQWSAPPTYVDGDDCNSAPGPMQPLARD